MTEKELKHMSRKELIELIAAMKKQELALRERLAQAERKLEDRSIQISEAGSIAQAALAINGIFEAAQQAAEDYLRAVKANHPDTDSWWKDFQ